ncbi:hypothetical protein [Levilactobacillus phage ENFP1]|nr:hypothetical protein [Levilactobacillus phage ENFP1]
MTDEKFKAYFYIGLNEPVLIATDIKGLKNTIIYDTYAGDVSEEFIETINSCTSMDDLKEELVDYDIYINPTKQDFIEANKAWFEPDGLENYLENW